MKNKSFIILISVIVFFNVALAQTPHGDRSNRARNDHSGNRIRVTYWNHGMMGSIKNDQSVIYGGEWPINSGLVQMGNASSYVCSELHVAEVLTYFGYAISNHENYVLIGSYNEDIKGAAYLYQKKNNWWLEQKKIAATSGEDGDKFGFAVSLSNNNAIIGAPASKVKGDSSGAAYVYFGLSSLTETKLVANDAAKGDNFGYAVSVYHPGDPASTGYAFVGAPKDDDNGSNSGSVYVFNYEGQWKTTPFTKLTPPAGSEGSMFGSAVASDQTHCIVGAKYDNELGYAAGAAHIFELSNGAWGNQIKLTASDDGDNSYFGQAVSILEPYAVVGAIGAVYVFEHVGANWVEKTKLTSNSQNEDLLFGRTVCLNAEAGATAMLSIGASNAVYLYKKDGENWAVQATLSGDAAATNGSFGSAVSLWSDVLLIGAHRDDEKSAEPGSIYFYEFENDTWNLKINPTEQLETLTPGIFCQGWDPAMFSHDAFGNFVGFEPLPGYFNTDYDDATHNSAMSDKPHTWPAFWPDKLNDAKDPGWKGKWNGYFGKGISNADQESYHVLDDYPFKKKIHGLSLPLPISSEPNRGGVGLRQALRGLQWSNPSAADCIFWIYDIKNIGELKLTKTLFGLNVGASMGALFGVGNDNWDDDGATFYREIGLTVNYEPDNIGTQGYSPVPWVGFAFLESPGNAVDGIDNDGDGLNAPGGGKIITTSDFIRFITEGEPVVLIDYKSDKLKRTVSTMPAQGVSFTHNGITYRKYPGTPLEEIPRNGIDDNLNGIIDEADADSIETGEIFYLYIRNTQYNDIDYLSIDYVTGDGLENKLIDERRDDGIDNDGDWDPLSDDVGLDGAEGTGDQGEGDGIPTPGYGDLPGEPSIDIVDVTESDQIGLTSFIFYEYGDVTYSNDDQIWLVSRPGFFDGHLEKVDADYIFATGYFPLLPNQREAFSVGMVYGWNETHIINNKNTVQDIYNANYNFAVAPDLPTVWAVPGDRKVTLYWDEKAEQSKDRYLNDFDFEGYKIYRATDPGFEDATTIVIDNNIGSFNIQTPIQVFDKIDGVYGNFGKADQYGISYFMGSDNGLVHTYVDSSLVNGMTYYYAVTAFDKGSLADNIYPSETRKYIAVDFTGEIQEKGSNVIKVVPTTPALGYIPPEFDVQPEHVGQAKAGSGYIRCRVIEPDSIIEGASYEIQFLDIATDGIDNDMDWNYTIHDVGSDGVGPDDVGYWGPDADSTEGNKKPEAGEPKVDFRDADEWIPLETSGFILKNITDEANPIILDTIWFKEYRVLDSSVVMIRNLYDDDDKIDASLRVISHGVEFLVYNPPAAPGILHMPDIGIVEGMKWSANIDPNQTYNLIFAQWDTTVKTATSYKPGMFYPRQYKVVFFDEIADTSEVTPLQLKNYNITIKIPAIPTNFKIYDLLTGEDVSYGFRESLPNSPVPKGHFSAKDEIWFLEKLPNDSTVVTFYILNDSKDDKTEFMNYYQRSLSSGDTLYVYPDIQFTSANRFRFSVKGQKLDIKQAKLSLDNIKVVPNPYVATVAWEPQNIYRSGRGPRMIQFIHLPSKCTIRIFSVDGSLVKKIEHDAPVTDGSEGWDLLTSDQMDIAYGLYIYHVDAPNIGQHIGRFIVIK